MGNLEELLRIVELISIASENLREGNLEEAVKNYNSVLVIDGNNKSALTGLGLTYYRGGEFGEAERFYKLALELEPENIESINRLAEAYIKQGKFDESIQEQTKILKSHPENIRARVGLGDSYECMGRHDDAIREYSAAVKQGLKATVTLGWMHLFFGKKYERKSQAKERILEREEIAMAYLGLRMAHIKKDEYLRSKKYGLQLKFFKLKIKAADFLYSLKP